MVTVNQFGRGIVAIHIDLEIPKRPSEITQERIHNRIVKDALRHALELHHKNRLPRHFKSGAHARYGYKTRGKAYNEKKRQATGKAIDLVLSGASRDNILAHKQIVMGGAAESSKKALEGTLVVRFAFNTQHKPGRYKAQQPGSSIRPYRPKAATAGVDLAQMKREVAAFDDRDRANFRDDFFSHYTTAIRNYKSGRKRVTRTGAVA